MPAFFATPFLDLAFRNPRFPRLGIECFRLSELRRRVTRTHYERVQRLQFHFLMLFTDGVGVQEIDFERIEGCAGVVTHVYPGQVQRWPALQDVEATIVLFTPEFVLPQVAEGSAGPLGRSELPTCLAFMGPDLQAVRAGFDALAAEYARTDGTPASEGVMRHYLAGLLLQLDRGAVAQKPAPASGAQLETFQMFRRAVEVSFTETRSVADYARLIGCSTKTLTRATEHVAGLPPKTYIDARVVLEARRLLAHTELPVAEIGQLLGFSEATNFTKFFKREGGQLPAAFREASRGAKSR